LHNLLLNSHGAMDGIQRLGCFPTQFWHGPSFIESRISIQDDGANRVPNSIWVWPC
jgi:hypothetical protein